jgi:hypothetical protein
VTKIKEILKSRAFPWVIIALMLIFYLIQSDCQHQKNIEIQKETAANRAIAEEYKKNFDEIVAINKTISVFAKKKIEDAIEKSDKAQAEAKEIKIISKAEVSKIKKENISWENKFNKISENYLKALDKIEIIEEDRKNLRETIVSINADLDDMMVNDAKLKLKFYEMKTLFDKQAKLTDKATKCNKFIWKAATVLFTGATVYFYIKNGGN